MHLFHLLNLLLNFAAPALGVALLCAAAGRFSERKKPARHNWRAYAAINFIAGLAALAGGLWFFGVDGKMATYAALVCAVGTSQWLLLGGWKA